MSNVVNQQAFLRTSRAFPEEMHQLAVEVNKSYLDIAQSVNNRTIGIFPTTRAAQNGNSYFLVANQRQLGFQQVYPFTTTGSIPHGITNFQPTQIIDAYGSYTEGTNAYGVIFGTSVAIAGEVSVYITSTDIVIQAGVGAPAIVSGNIVLLWASRP
jgi:hypothetical protein